ncbi:hypothetical protein VVD49_10150 [Uliginosibacterium sp. H3]|uniref:Tetratricopeptide repeat protein n=1 Tax=Uliginosibacterium silvisoli TaxID=3114758 RepID=A0ABU6K2E0_9RHOO|nr:hypothetical protein [Uliginosibacterium sp. H3]
MDIQPGLGALMSVINTMLRNLDERRAGAARDPGLLDEIAVPAHQQEPARHRLLLVAPVLAAAVVAVVALYFWPRAEASARADLRPPGAVQAPLAVVTAVAAAEVSEAPVSQQAVPAATTPEHAARAEEPATGAREAMLVLATSMADVGDATTPSKASKPVRRAVVEVPSAASAQVSSSMPLATPEPQRSPARTELRPAARVSPALPQVVESGSIRVEQSTQTPAERNQMEVQHAAELLQRGAVVEAEASLRSVLANDKGMLAARQALFALLQRQQRSDEARALLRDGVSLAPTQASLLLPYARLLAARGEWGAAYEALAPASEVLAQDAEYRGLCGVALQRLGRYPQSVAEYRAAVKLAPTASAWWVGLGLSLEGDGKPGEARAAYLQARATPLGPELAQFVSNKLARVSATE